MTSFAKITGIPLYVQIRESLRSEIASARLIPGQKIPSEDELAIKYSVSRMTVRQGISDLIDEGVLYRRQGVGTFVAQPHISRDHTRLTNFMESASAKGINASLRVELADILPARLRVAKALALEEGELAIHIITILYADGTPVTLHDAYFPYKLFPGLLQDDYETRSLWDLMEQYGYPVKQATQLLEAREADEKLCKYLEIEVGAPILYKERTVYAEDGTPVEFTYCYNRGDRYSLTVTLYR